MHVYFLFIYFKTKQTLYFSILKKICTKIKTKKTIWNSKCATLSKNMHTFQWCADSLTWGRGAQPYVNNLLTWCTSGPFIKVTTVTHWLSILISWDASLPNKFLVQAVLAFFLFKWGNKKKYFNNFIKQCLCITLTKYD